MSVPSKQAPNPTPQQPPNQTTDAATRRADHVRTKRLMQALIASTADRWPSATRFIDLCDAEAGLDPITRIMFLTSVRKIISEMPVKVFLSMEQRDQVLDAAQEALDELIDTLEIEEMKVGEPAPGDEK